MPRASAKDIAEIFGFAPDDTSAAALSFWDNNTCPFVNRSCTKTNHDQSVVYGTCSVLNTNALGTYVDEVVICPKRLYANNYQTLREVSSMVFGDLPLIVGGTIQDLRNKLIAHGDEAVVAFGQGSGNEIQITSGGQLSMDWILQKYSIGPLGAAEPDGFIGIEVQSIDITGNYRDNWGAYNQLHQGQNITSIPNAAHGMNWANVHKRLIPQIIRKGNIYKNCETCLGFFFIVPDIVYQRFEAILDGLEFKDEFSKSNVSVQTYGLGPEVDAGAHRPIEAIRTVHFALEDMAHAFISNVETDAVIIMEENIRGMLGA